MITAINAFDFVSFAVLLIASISDLCTGKIYNWLTIPAALSGLILSIAINSPVEIFSKIIGVVFLILFSCFRLMGTGDIKLIIAITMFSGFVVAMGSVAIGSAMVLLYWIKKAKIDAFKGIYTTLLNLKTTGISNNVSGGLKESVPFAPFMLFGFVVLGIGRLLLC